MLSLKEIPGVGDSLTEKLIFEIGSLADVERVIKDGDVSTLSGIEGISPQRAVKLINLANNNSNEITNTEDGRRLHKDLITSICDFVVTKAAKERLSILTPLTRDSIVEIESRRNWSKNAIRFINDSKTSFELWKKYISGLSYTKEPTSRIDRVIVVPNTIELKNLKHIENTSSNILGSIFLNVDLWMPELLIFDLNIRLSVKFPPRGLILRSKF